MGYKLKVETVNGVVIADNVFESKEEFDKALVFHQENAESNMESLKTTAIIITSYREVKSFEPYDIRSIIK